MGGFAIPAAIPLLIFLSVSSFFVAVYLHRTRDPLLERIRALTRGSFSFRDRLALWGNSMARSSPLVSKYFGYTGTEKRLKAAGFPMNMTADEFLAVKLVLMGLTVLVFLVSLITGKFLIVIFGLALFLPDWILNSLIASRKKAIDKDFVLAAGRMAAAARAGESLPAALKWAAHGAGPAMAHSINWCLSNLEAGIPIENSLDTLAGETGLLSIRRMATTLINAQKFSTGIADALISAAEDASRRWMDDLAVQLEDRQTVAELAMILMVLSGMVLLIAPMLIQVRGVGFY